MNHLSKLSLTAITIAMLLLGCSKAGGGTDTNLASGQSSLEFNTNIDFGGSREYRSNTPMQSKTIKGTQATKDNITLVAIQSNGTQIATAQLSLLVPVGSTTTSGSISGKFENGSTASTQAVLVIGSSNAGSNQKSYTSKTGNFTITKLTATELEGSFDAVCENSTTNESITLTNGKFIGKF